MNNEPDSSVAPDQAFGQTTGPEEDTDSRRYWRAAISHLSDPQKRDAAWDFYLRKLEARQSGDTLSGLVLLLEANGAFLASLPEKIQQELFDPLSERLTTLKDYLAAHQAHESEMLAVLEKAAERNANTNARAIATVVKVEDTLRRAATSIDARALVNSVKDQLEDEALQPFKRVLKDLVTSTKCITEATVAAETAVQKWRRVHLGGVAAGLLALAFFAFLIASLWYRRDTEHRFEERFTNALVQLDTSRGSLSQLAKLGVVVRIVSSADNDGNAIPDHYAVVIDQAEAADLREFDGRRQGVVFVRAADLFPRVKSTPSVDKVKPRN
ncbi:MAG: hypothetical protein WDN28_23500 [Chthoniobacter sp.]